MHQPKVCVVCHAQFTPQRRPAQVTCCNRCYMWNRNHPGVPDRPRSCVQCGRDLPPGTHRSTVHCDIRCRAAASKRRCRSGVAAYVRHPNCGHCGVALVDKKAGARFCGEQCERRERMFPGSAEYFANRTCEYCGRPIPNEARYNKRHCTNNCTAMANQVIRRARMEALPAEQFSRWAVFERDGWICHLCRLPVDKTLRSRDPMMASLDHIIPFNEPGCPGHVWTNVALAHLFCNFSKNARARHEDWSLHLALTVTGEPPLPGQLF